MKKQKRDLQERAFSRGYRAGIGPPFYPKPPHQGGQAPQAGPSFSGQPLQAIY